MKCLECAGDMGELEKCGHCGWTYHQDLDEEDLKAKPVCITCLTPTHALDHYCSNCGSVVGRYTPYIPFVWISFQLSVFHKIWKAAWYGEGLSPGRRIFYILLCCLFSSLFLIGIVVELLKKALAKPQ